MLPSFLIVGAQKAGTTFLHGCLARHPQVAMAPGETRFFQDPYYRPSTEPLEALFRHARGARAAGIARPDYLARPECAERIHQMLPHARLLVILRDPVERAISAYYHQMKWGFLPLAHAEQGLRRVLAGEYDRAWPKSREILEYGLYHRHLTRFLKHFPEEHILCLRFEDLRKRPDATLRGVLRFLGADEAVALAIPSRASDRNEGSYALSRSALHRLRVRLAYRFDEQRTRAEARASLPHRAAGRLVQVFDRHVMARIVSNHKPSISAEIRDHLRAFYQSDLEQLEYLLGWNLRDWRFGRATTAPVAIHPRPQPAPALPTAA
jgi:hypothetical protein